MRMRLKRHLNDRVEKCKHHLIPVDKSIKNAKLACEQKTYIDFSEYYEDENKPLHMDLGCGKGSFSIQLAKKRPDINVVGVEMITNVLLSAIENLDSENLNNLKFMNTGADYLLKYFKPQSISVLYLNFSTPKQKNSYANSRLTSPKFLEIYKELLAPDGIIIQKTDDKDFFEYSLEQLSANFDVKEVITDLHKIPCEDNIITEYEANFMKINKPIMRITATLKPKVN